ncbi:hypothetical protein KHA80_02200 [Anaerobacillus sp. HL2]|nr:hypothetical protein KHA80_02200 [Anaerobacillus sp. HL2]
MTAEEKFDQSELAEIEKGLWHKSPLRDWNGKKTLLTQDFPKLLLKITLKI